MSANLAHDVQFCSNCITIDTSVVLQCIVAGLGLGRSSIRIVQLVYFDVEWSIKCQLLDTHSVNINY